MKITTEFGVCVCERAERHKDGVYLIYKNDDGSDSVSVLGNSIEITSVEDGEIVDVESPEATQLDIIEAQLAYTALMTDTLLEV